MKILSKIFIFSVLVTLLYSCNDDDTRDHTDIQAWDKTPVSFTQDIEYEGGVLDVDVNFSSNGNGIIYYAVVPAESEYDVTAQGLRQEYGKESGNGISGQILGGSFDVSEGSNKTISFVGERGTKYIVFSSADNSYDYIGELKSNEVTLYCNVNPKSDYSSFATSEEIGLDDANAVEGSTAVEPIEGTCNQYFAESLWGNRFVSVLTGDDSYLGQYVYPAILTVNDDMSVDVTAASDADFYVSGGTGTYNPDTKEFDLILTQSLFSSDFKVRVVLK